MEVWSLPAITVTSNHQRSDFRPPAQKQRNRSKSKCAADLRSAQQRQQRWVLERLELWLAIAGHPQPGIRARELFAECFAQSEVEA